MTLVNELDLHILKTCLRTKTEVVGQGLQRLEPKHDKRLGTHAEWQYGYGEVILHFHDQTCF